MQTANFFDKIPIVLGVTGHRNIVKDDYPQITQAVENGFMQVLELTKSGKGQTPLVLLTGLAQGADMLVTDVAIKLGVPYVAVLPCELDEFKLSFDDTEALCKLDGYIADALDVVIAGDIEGDFQRQQQYGQTQESYRYRQVGVYIAERSHVLFGLWDGKLPKSRFGCGTAEVIDFAINESFVKKNVGHRFGALDDATALWIKCRRQGDGSECDVTSKYILPNVDVGADNSLSEQAVERFNYKLFDEMPAAVADTIRKTAEYNDAETPGGGYGLLSDLSELSPYQQRLHRHYIKSDLLSVNAKNAFTKLLLAMSVLGSLLAFMFMLYDESGYIFLSIPCVLIVGVIVFVYVYNGKSAVHRKHVEYRALSETLRTQFYVSACGVTCDISDYYTWAQRNDCIWIYKAVMALSVGNIQNKRQNLDAVKDTWISIDKGQYRYHHKKKTSRMPKIRRRDIISKALLGGTLALYFAIFVIEVLTMCKVTTFFDTAIGVNEMTWRNVAQVCFGVLTMVSLLITSYFGKLSEERQFADNAKMERLYLSACSKWDVDSEHFEELVVAIAREEIIENGIWLSYMTDNDLEINV